MIRPACGWRCAGLAVLLLACARCSQAAGVVVVQSDDSPPYREFTAALRSRLSNLGGGEVDQVMQVRELENERPGAEGGDRLYVAVGLRAARALHSLHPHAQVLAALVPRASFELVFGPPASDEGGRAASAIWLDQPLGRQFDLVRIALPRVQRIGVLLGPRSSGLQGELERQAREHELHLVSEQVDGAADLVPALSRLLVHADLLLALPDDTVYNPASAETVLLLSYRRSVPLLAFSHAYVKAGALLALHTAPEQFGRQAAELLAPVLQTGARSLPPPQYPRYWQVSWNRAVAQSLEIQVREDAEAALHAAGSARP